jgi:hypothetical protein
MDDGIAAPEGIRGSRPWGKVAAKAALVAVLALYSRRFLTSNAVQLGYAPGFFHYIHTVFHEAGHWLLAWSPPVVHTLGGTLGQWAMPLACALAFAVKRDGFAAAICGWWLGHSVVDAAPYINDARLMELPLLGGATGQEIEGHDWNFLLEKWDLLELDHLLAQGVLAAGRCLMVMALLAAAALTIYHVSMPHLAAASRNGPSLHASGNPRRRASSR